MRLNGTRALSVRADTVCFVYTCRRLIDLSAGRYGQSAAATAGAGHRLYAVQAAGGGALRYASPRAGRDALLRRARALAAARQGDPRLQSGEDPPGLHALAAGLRRSGVI